MTARYTGLFAIVLGLFAWIYLIAELTVYAAELNVVLARHLWPRCNRTTAPYRRGPQVAGGPGACKTGAGLNSRSRCPSTANPSQRRDLWAGTGKPAKARYLRLKTLLRFEDRLRFEDHKVKRAKQQHVEGPHPDPNSPVKLVHFGHLRRPSGAGPWPVPGLARACLAVTSLGRPAPPHARRPA